MGIVAATALAFTLKTDNQNSFIPKPLGTDKLLSPLSTTIGQINDRIALGAKVPDEAVEISQQEYVQILDDERGKQCGLYLYNRMYEPHQQSSKDLRRMNEVDYHMELEQMTFGASDSHMLDAESQLVDAGFKYYRVGNPKTDTLYSLLVANEEKEIGYVIGTYAALPETVLDDHKNRLIKALQYDTADSVNNVINTDPEPLKAGDLYAADDHIVKPLYFKDDKTASIYHHFVMLNEDFNIGIQAVDFIIIDKSFVRTMIQVMTDFDQSIKSNNMSIFQQIKKGIEVSDDAKEKHFNQALKEFDFKENMAQLESTFLYYFDALAQNRMRTHAPRANVEMYNVDECDLSIRKGTNRQFYQYHNKYAKRQYKEAAEILSAIKALKQAEFKDVDSILPNIVVLRNLLYRFDLSGLN